MDKDRKERLARQGLRAMELAEPGAITKKAKDAIGDAAGSAALAGIAAVGRLTGKDRSPAVRDTADTVDLDPTFSQWAAADAADFESRLRRSVADKAREEREAEQTRAEREANRAKRQAAKGHAAAEGHATAEGRRTLAELRRSFPPASRELALLIFHSADLLEDLSAEARGRPPTAAELERKEQLLTRLAEALAPRAGEALTSFVAHVVETSAQQRGSGGRGEGGD